jgi:predicted enzyme related to lactoylglutathione lyase
MTSFIWYELLTPDPDAAKTFYDAVVGWDIEPQPAGPIDYRMIRRGDGGNAGGVMRLSPEMASNSDVFSVDRPGHVRWNELTTSDPDGAADFYRRHFGWTQEGSMPMGELGDYRFLQDSGTAIGAIMGLIPPNTRPQWSFYIGVDDIDRAAEAVRAGGGQVLMGPHEIPGGEYSLNGVDPQGASFGLVGPRQA